MSNEIEVPVVLPARLKEVLDLMAWESGRTRSDVLSELVESSSEQLYGDRFQNQGKPHQVKPEQLSLLESAG